MNILLAQLDGRLPNVALMRIAAHHRALGDEIDLRLGAGFEVGLWDRFDRVYASAIFRRSIPLMERLRRVYPDAIIGGTAIDPPRKGEIVPLSPVMSPTYTALEPYGIGIAQDYDLYPRERRSIGYTQRGCRLDCDFCGMRSREGPARQVATIADIWRGDPWPRELVLLDNDFFGQAHWRDRMEEIRSGRFKVSFNQGVNIRFITDEAAEAIASVDYRNGDMTDKRIYTAWDNQGDEERLFVGLRRLVKYGVRPDHIMVYILVGYWPGENAEDRDYRRRRLREFGARPYPMPWVKTPELQGFQRWCVGAYDKRIPWADWEANGYRPEGIGAERDLPLLLEEETV
jgi:hypothetical protein